MRSAVLAGSGTAPPAVVRFDVRLGEVLFAGGFARDRILAVEPASEVDQLAAFRAERTELPLFFRNRPLAGGAAHGAILRTRGTPVHRVSPCASAGCRNPRKDRRA